MRGSDEIAFLMESEIRDKNCATRHGMPDDNPERTALAYERIPRDGRHRLDVYQACSR